MGVVNRQNHIVSPVSYWFASFSFHTNQTNNSRDSAISKFDLETSKIKIILCHKYLRFSSNAFDVRARQKLLRRRTRPTRRKRTENIKGDLTRTRWRCVKQSVNISEWIQSHAQHKLWISRRCISYKFHKIMPGWSYSVNWWMKI